MIMAKTKKLNIRGERGIESMRTFDLNLDQLEIDYEFVLVQMILMTVNAIV